MSTNYTGNLTATQAPGPTPSLGANPIVNLPADGEAGSAASITQAFKECADYLAFVQDKVNRIISDTITLGGIWIDSSGNVNRTASLGHVCSAGTLIAFTAGTGAGTGPVTTSTAGADFTGTIDITTGTGPAGASATIISAPFTTTYGSSNPLVFLCPDNANAAALSGATQVFATATATTLSLKSGSSGLTASTNYRWKYVVFGF